MSCQLKLFDCVGSAAKWQRLASDPGHLFTSARFSDRAEFLQVHDDHRLSGSDTDAEESTTPLNLLTSYTPSPFSTPIILCSSPDEDLSLVKSFSTENSEDSIMSTNADTVTVTNSVSNTWSASSFTTSIVSNYTTTYTLSSFLSNLDPGWLLLFLSVLCQQAPILDSWVLFLNLQAHPVLQYQGYCTNTSFLSSSTFQHQISTGQIFQCYKKIQSCMV